MNGALGRDGGSGAVWRCESDCFGRGKIQEIQLSEMGTRVALSGRKEIGDQAHSLVLSQQGIQSSTGSRA